MKRYRTLATNALHAGERPEDARGAVVTPIFQSANFLQREEENYHDVRYMRLSNSPNHQVLGARIAALEGTEDALVATSGMAAITAAILSHVHTGEHLLAHKTLYGGSQGFLDHDAPKLGLSVTSVDFSAPDTWKAALRPTTRAFYVEGITNPLMEVGELHAVVEFCREHGLISLIDNTIPTPVNFRPTEIGFDLILHSATKYYNGHSDIVAGIVAGSHDRIRRVTELLNHLGGSLDAHACFLLERGMKTLAVRMAHHNQSALRLATVLERTDGVTRVNYPGLASNPGNIRAAALFKGCSGMLSIYVHSSSRADRFFERVQIPRHAASLGSVESLVVRPARSTHLGMEKSRREALGVTDTLIRISVGLEDIEELIDDFTQALA